MTAAVFSAVYLGFLCSISPCPMATNIATISFIGRKSGRTDAVLYSGLFYAIGRILTFCVLGSLLASMLDFAPEISHFLQKYVAMFLGPCLILIAMVLLDLLKIPAWGGYCVNGEFLQWIEKCGVFRSLLLGVIFALSFCPVSAALFFGTLLPLSLKVNAPLLLSGIFGAASCVPVLLFAFVLAFATKKLANVYNFVGKLEIWTRRITGIIFLLIGFYFTLFYMLC